MRNSAAFRLVSHICFFYTFIALVPHICPESFIPLYVIIGLALASCLAAVHIKSAALRLLAALIPFVGLLLISRSATVLAAAVPLVYAAIMLVSGSFYGEAWKYRRLFIPLALIAGALFLLLLIYAYSANYATKDVSEEIRGISESLPFLFGFFLFGFLSLRAQRPGDIRSAKWQGGIAGYYALTLACAAALGVALYFIAPPIIWFFSLIIYPIGYILSFLTNLLGPIEWTKPIADIAFVTPDPTALPDPGEAAPDSQIVLPTEDPGFTRLFKFEEINLTAVLIGIIALAVLIVLIIHLSKGRREQESLSPEEAAVPDNTPFIERTRFVRRRRRLEPTNADRVREIYRSYIGFLRNHGFTPRVSTTSEELSDRSRELLLDEQPDLLLRSLYLRARYAGAELTGDDVLIAKQALERITSDENKK
ncbi:MAG: DUF4129 domain-containing protein [Clostridia bacterium]|nr:DUF4129 domain-containing protein [Clostridia bacterium]